MAATANDTAHAAPNDEAAFWDAHARELVAQYPDQYVAVHQGCVVAASAGLPAIVAALQALGLEPVQVWLRFLNAGLVNVVL